MHGYATPQNTRKRGQAGTSASGGMLAEHIPAGTASFASWSGPKNSFMPCTGVLALMYLAGAMEMGVESSARRARSIAMPVAQYARM